MRSRPLLALCALLFTVPLPTSADPTLLVANKEGASVWFLDPLTGESRARLPTRQGPHEVAVSPDDRIAAVANYGDRSDGHTLTIVDVARAEVVRTVDLSPHHRPHGLRFLDDHRVVVSSETSGQLVEVDVREGRVIRAHDAGGDIHMVDLLPDGRIAATAIGGGALCIVDLSGETEPQVIDTGSGTEALAVRPGGREVWVGNNREHVVRIVDLELGEVTGEIECGLQPIRLAFTPDGKHALATCILTGDLVVLDADARRIRTRVLLADNSLRESDWRDKPEDELRAMFQDYLPNGARPIGVLPSADGLEIFVANRGLEHVAVVSTSTWEVVRRLPAGRGPRRLGVLRRGPPVRVSGAASGEAPGPEVR